MWNRIEKRSEMAIESVGNGSDDLIVKNCVRENWIYMNKEREREREKDTAIYR